MDDLGAAASIQGQTWIPASGSPYGPGWRCYVHGTGMPHVGLEENGYRFWLQTGPNEAFPGRGGFADPGHAMRDAAQVADRLKPRIFAALTRDELLALYRELAKAYPQDRDGSGAGDRWFRELDEVRSEVFRQMEITALDPHYIGPEPTAFARAARLASFGAVAQAENTSPSRPSWVRTRPDSQAPGPAPRRRQPAGPPRHRAGRMR